MAADNARVTPPVTPRSRSNNYERPETRDTRGYVPSSLRSDGRTAPKTARNYLQAEVLAAIGAYIRAHSIPPLDRGLRSIVAQQVSNLLQGGWPFEEIKRTALALVAKYDRWGGHKSMVSLQRVMELADEDRALKKHQAQAAVEVGPLDTRVAKILGVAKRDPRNLPSNHRPDGDPCRICQGPPGVHVRFENIPDLEAEAMAQLEHARQVRRPMRSIATGLAAAPGKGEPPAPNLSNQTQRPGELADA